MLFGRFIAHAVLVIGDDSLRLRSAADAMVHSGILSISDVWIRVLRDDMLPVWTMGRVSTGAVKDWICGDFME